MLKGLKAELLFHRGQRRFKAGKTMESIDLYDRVIELSPTKGGIYLHKAIALASLKKYQEAIEILKKATSLNSDNSAYHLWLGIIYFDIDRMNEAIEQFDKALNISSDNDLVSSFKYLAQVHLDREVAHNCTGLLKKAEYTNTLFKTRMLLFSETVALQNKEKARFLNDTMFIETYLQKDGNAGGFASRFLQNTGHLFSRIYTGVFYLFAPVKRKASQQYIEGIGLLKRGDLDGAAAQFTAALNALPDFEEARSILIDLYLYQGKFDEVLQLLKSAEGYQKIASILYSDASLEGKTSELGQHLNLILALGVYHFYAGQYKRAVRLLRYIIGFSDSYFDDYYLGLSYLAGGDRDNALSSFKNALEKLNPSLTTGRLKEAQRLFTEQPV